MLIIHNREKLIQAILYFASNTNYCGKVKLFKLLYFLDFQHFTDTGRSVTGLSYSAWKMGPVPTELFDEIESPEPDLAASVSISSVPVKSGKPMLKIDPLVEFDKSLFTRRELKLMESLVSEYADTLSDDMVEATHVENQPWDRVFNKEGKKQAPIPYEYALRRGEEGEMLRMIEDRSDTIKALS